MSASTDDWKIKNNIFDLTNKHRAHSVLRLSINGDHVVNVHPESLSDKTTKIELNDKHVIEIKHIETHNNDISEYEFTWINSGPSIDKEVCFHYGHNKSSW